MLVTELSTDASLVSGSEAVSGTPGCAAAFPGNGMSIWYGEEGSRLEVGEDGALA